MISTRAALMPGSDRACPAVGIIARLAPGQAAWIRQAVQGGQIMS